MFEESGKRKRDGCGKERHGGGWSQEGGWRNTLMSVEAKELLVVLLYI